MIRVACAAITKKRSDGQMEILLFRGADGTAYAGLWCTPAAIVEPHESDTEVLERELSECVGVVIWSVKPIPVYKYREAVFVEESIFFCYDAKAHTVYPRINTGALDDYGWFGADDLDELPLSPVDAANRDALKKLLREGGR